MSKVQPTEGMREPAGSGYVREVLCPPLVESFDARLSMHYNGKAIQVQAWEETQSHMPQALVYIVILNWNLKDETAECITSVLRSDYPNYRVLVVDNGSTDGSPEYLAQIFPEAEIAINPANWGFSAGNNVGIRQALKAGAQYVFLLNNDTTVDPHMLTSLVDCAESAASIGLVAPKVLYYARPDTIWRLGERTHKWLPVPVSVGRNAMDRGQFHQPLDVDYVTFCGVLIRRTALERIGLLDERFFFTYEDADLCHRARDSGFRIVCQPLARMWHKVSLSAHKDTASISYVKAKSRAIFYRLYPHGPHPCLTVMYLWANTLSTALATLCRGDRQAAKEMIHGLYAGYHEDLSAWRAHGNN